MECAGDSNTNAEDSAVENIARIANAVQVSKCPSVHCPVSQMSTISQVVEEFLLKVFSKCHCEVMFFHHSEQSLKGVTLVQLVHKWVHCLPIISDKFPKPKCERQCHVLSCPQTVSGQLNINVSREGLKKTGYVITEDSRLI